MKTTRLALCLGGLLALTLGAAANAAGPLAFPTVDLNKDGYVSWEEAHIRMPRLAKIHFEKCDIGGDGLIDQNEYPLLSTFYWQNYIMSN